MKVVTLEISDDFFDQFTSMLDTFPIDKVKYKQDYIKDEIEKRLKAIDDETEVLTPYNEGMTEMRERLRSRYANS
jgi:hypothetical protein